MKIIMKIFSFLLVAVLAVILIGMNFDLGSDFTRVTLQVTALLWACVLPIIIIAIACLCLQKKTEGILMNTILAIEVLAIALASATIFLPLQDISEVFYDIVTKTQSIITTINIYILCFTLLRLVSPNNLISNIMQKTGYIAIIVNIIFQVWLWIKSGLIEVLPNVYGHDGFDFASLGETTELVGQVYLISFIVEIFAIILTFITNHAFEIDTIDVDQVDYDQLKKQADSIAQNKFNNIYTIKSDSKKDETPKQSEPTQKGVMNINNQLGKDSNVGQIENKQAAPTTNFVDKGIPTSSGPVINDNLTQQNTNTSMQPTPSNSVSTPIPTNPLQQPAVNQNTPFTPAPTPSPSNPMQMQNNQPINNSSPLAQALGNTPPTNTEPNNPTNKFLN